MAAMPPQPCDDSSSDEGEADDRHNQGSFQDLLREAARLKTCQLNEIRRSYETSPEFAQASLHCEDAACVAARKAPLAEACRVCCAVREEGNAAVKARDHEGALRRYGDAISVFRWFVDENDHRPLRDRIPPSSANPETPECSAAPDVRTALGACYRNAAACLLALDQPNDAVWACDRALELDANDAKALFRRATARLRADASAGDDEAGVSVEVLRTAVADLKACCVLVPKDRAARLEYEKRRKQLQAVLGAQAAAFGGLFAKASAKGGLYTPDEAAAVTSPDDATGGGEDPRVAAARDAMAASLLEGSYVDPEDGLMRAKDGRVLI